VGGRESR